MSWSGKYKAVLKLGSNGLQWDAGDPVVGKFLQMVVQPYAGQDVSMNPVTTNPPNRASRWVKPCCR